MEKPPPDPKRAAARERLRRLRKDLEMLSSAIREELDWRDKLYPANDDHDEDDTL